MVNRVEPVVTLTGEASSWYDEGMKSLTYQVLIKRQEEGGYGVFVPALPGCVTWGRTFEEAVNLARDAIKAYVASLRKRGEPIPEDHTQATVSLGISVRFPTRA